MATKVKSVSVIVPGDRVPVVRTVVEVRRTMSETTVVFDDGSTQTFNAASDAAFEVEE